MNRKLKASDTRAFSIIRSPDAALFVLFFRSCGNTRRSKDREGQSWPESISPLPSSYSSSSSATTTPWRIGHAAYNCDWTIPCSIRQSKIVKIERELSSLMFDWVLGCIDDVSWYLLQRCRVCIKFGTPFGFSSSCFIPLLHCYACFFPFSFFIV